jgi:Zn ribbon nucleic-acid-binding protein
MWIEEYIPSPESSEWGWNSKEAAPEVVEKSRESAKKSSAWIARTQKDEKKAKKYDLFLAWFLVKIIVDKKYDFILVKLLKASNFWYTSNFTLWILSLINIEISNKIRQHNNKTPINFSYKADKIIAFNSSELPKKVQDRINYWIEDIIDCITLEYSNIQTEKVINCLENDKNWIINDYISDILTFFLKNINIIINENEAQNVTLFIISEVSKSIKKLEINEV